MNTWTNAVALNCEYEQNCNSRGPERGNRVISFYFNVWMLLLQSYKQF